MTTTPSLASQLGPGDQRKSESPNRIALRRFLRKRVAVVCLAFILLVYLAGLFAPLVAPYGFNEQNLDKALQPPSLEHPFGTDRLGRDQLSRVIWGARTALMVSVLAVSFGTVLGVSAGLAAGYFRGWVDTALMRVSDILFAFPAILLVIIFAGTLREPVAEWVRTLEDQTGWEGILASGAVDYFLVFTALALVGWAGLARIVRSQVLTLREREYVDASLSIGASGYHVMRKHIFPNVRPIILVLVTTSLGVAVTSEVTLSWLGLGIQPPNPSWGRMIFENNALLRTPQWFLLVFPVTLVGLVFLAFSLLGDGLNDALNPRSR